MRACRSLSMTMVLALCAGCQQPTYVLVVPAPLPIAARSVQLLVTLDGAPAAERLLFQDRVKEQVAIQREASLRLDLPAGTQGELSVAVGVFGEGDCLIGSGAAAGSEPEEDCLIASGVAAGSPASGRLPVRLEAAAGRRDAARPDAAILGSAELVGAAGRTPARLWSAGQDGAGTPQRLRLRGFGFTPGAAVLVGGEPSPEVEWVSPLELVARVPPVPRAAGDRVPLAVIGRDGSRVERSGLLLVVPSRLRFRPALPLGLRARITAGGPFGLALGDYDNDGRLDIAVGHAGGRDAFLLHNETAPGGEVRFGAPEALTYEGEPYYVHLADLDQDGKRDLVVETFKGSSAEVYVHYNRLGAAPTPFAATGVKLATGDVGRTLPVDYDGDGKIDLVSTLAIDDLDPAQHQLRVYRNEGARRFAVAGPPCPLPPQDDTYYTFPVGDVDGDRIPDLVAVTRERSPGVRIFRGNPAGRCVPAQTVASVPRFLTVGDIDGDGRGDLVGTESDRLVFLQQGADGQFGATTARQVSVFPGASYNFPLLADLDLDGRPELLLELGLGDGPNSLVVLRNRGGQFPLEDVRSPDRADLELGSFASYYGVGDVDGDGLPDIVIVADRDVNVLLALPEAS